MATTAPAAPPSAGPNVGNRAERRFFTAYLLAITVAAFVGFAPSFFLRGIVEPVAPLQPLRLSAIIHALVVTAWVLVFPLQALLIARGRHAQHIRIGKVGFALGALAIATAYWATSVRYQDTPPPGMNHAMLVVAPVIDIVVLSIMLMLAWRWRTNGQAHKRAIVVVAGLLIGPALGRMPFLAATTLAEFLLSLLIIYLMTLAPLWLWDLSKLRRLHRVTMIGTGIVAARHIGMVLVAPTSGFSAFVAALPGFGPT
jgi:hypothetical protein